MRVRLKSRGLTYRLLEAPLRAYAKLDQGVERARAAGRLFLEGFVLRAFDAGELSELTIAIYDSVARFSQELLGWEQPWFERALPLAPGRVLVAAAGEGREVRAFRALGFDVDAFEPTSTLTQLRAAVGTGLALRGDFSDLVRAVRGEATPLAPLAARRYDAILLGWASLSHVPDLPSRRALFAACQALCPRGPILASFVMRNGGSNERPSRARRWGTRTGDFVRAVRRVEPPEPESGGKAFWLHAGVVHLFDREELEALGRAIGRSVELERSPYAHATWFAPRS